MQDEAERDNSLQIKNSDTIKSSSLKMVGRDFDIERVSFDINSDLTSIFDAIGRNFVALLIFLGSFGFLAISAFIGLKQGKYNELDAVWRAVSPILFTLAGYYFGKRK